MFRDHLAAAVSTTESAQQALLPAVGGVVAHYSRAQAAKGVLSAGITKSAVYSARKLVKMFRK
jgi:hypothetical protein